MYFAKEQLTFHPVVVHYRENDALHHKSYVVASEERSHSAPIVYSFLHTLIPKIRDDLQTLQHIHYITDSPSSQYWNIHIFSVLAKHQQGFYDISCSGVPPAWGIDDAYDILLRVMLLPSRPVCSWMPGLDRTCAVPTTSASSYSLAKPEQGQGKKHEKTPTSRSSRSDHGWLPTLMPSTV